MRPSETLKELAKLYEDRNKEYGNNYLEAGVLFRAMFPSGITLNTNMDFNRFALLVHITNKLQRYVVNFEHPIGNDHLRDLAVYATMLTELDEIAFGKPK